MNISFEYTCDDYNDYSELEVLRLNVDIEDISQALQQVSILKQTLIQSNSFLKKLRAKFTKTALGETWNGARLSSFQFSLEDQDHLKCEQKVFFKNCAKYPELDSLLIEYINLTGNNYFTGEAYWGQRMWLDDESFAGEAAAFYLALRDITYVRVYAHHLCDSDLGHEVNQSEEIDTLCNKWGACDEILYLIALRCTVACGQHGGEQCEHLLDQFVFKTALEDLSYLKSFCRSVVWGGAIR